MLMVLEIGKRRRRGLREYLRSALQPPRRLEVREVVRETGRYGILTAYPDKKGELPWEDVRQAAGKEARHLLCPAGCTLPEEEGLLPFRPSGQMQGQLMQQAALFLLRRASRGKKQRRIAVGVYDPDGVRPDLAVSLLPYAAEVQVNTGCPQRYRSAGRIAMEEYGASLTLVGTQADVRGLQMLLLLAPLPCLPEGGGLILSACGTREKQIGGDFYPRIPLSSGPWLAGLPEGVDPALFWEGLYERSGVRDMVAEPPDSVWLSGRRRPLPELLARIPGLDIGAATSYNEMTI